MPKLDLLRTIDTRRNSGNGIVYLSANSNVLAPNPAPATVHSGVSGQWYIGPTTVLMAAVAAADDSIIVADDYLLSIDDEIVLADGRGVNETATVIGGPEAAGAYWRYTLSRSDGRIFPAGGTVTSLGGVSDGGYFVINSGERGGSIAKAPHLNIRERRVGGDVHVMRLGQLRNLPASLKAEFPGVSDAEWNAAGYGLAAAGSSYFAGKIWALGGDILGDIAVSGTINVLSGVGQAGVTIGRIEGGYGLSLLNEFGRPSFSAVSPYTDENGNFSDVALIIDHEGRRGLYYHRNPDTGRYSLDIAFDAIVGGQLRVGAELLIGSGLRLTADGMESRDTEGNIEVGWSAQTGIVSAAEGRVQLQRQGIVIDTTIGDGGTASDAEIRWLHEIRDEYGAMRKYSGVSIFSTPGMFSIYSEKPDADFGDSDWSLLRLSAEKNTPSMLVSDSILLHANTGGGVSVNVLGLEMARFTPTGLFATQFQAGEQIYVVDNKIGLNNSNPVAPLEISHTTWPLRISRMGTTDYLDMTYLDTGEAAITTTTNLFVGGAAVDTALSVFPLRTVNLGSTVFPFESLFVRKLTAGEVVGASDMTTMSGSLVSGRAMTLAFNLPADAAVAYFTTSLAKPGDFMRFRAGGVIKTIKFIAGPFPAGGVYEYTIQQL